jgi:hypothetical protein
MFGFVRQAPNRSTIELLLMIVSMSSLTIGNTNVGSSAIYSAIILLNSANDFI